MHEEVEIEREEYGADEGIVPRKILGDGDVGVCYV